MILCTMASNDDTRPAWDLLEQRVDGLIAAWARQPEPPLAPFVPDHPPDLRRLVLTELVKVDLEQRASHQRPVRRIEEYIAEFPELAVGGVPCDLLYEEYHVRQRLGEKVDLDEYRRRFPDRASELGRLMGRDSTYVSTTLIAARPTFGFQVGDTVLDDFELKSMLGEGAFAKVFLAYQRSMQRLVALKVTVDRSNEPQTLGRLDHPHIVRVFDQRSLPEGKQRLLYMEFLAGGTLQDLVAHARTVPVGQRSGKTFLEAIDRSLMTRGAEPIESAARRLLETLTWPQAVAWVGARLAEGLAAAHRQGVLHRDIKPANVLLGADARPRLADFNVGFCSKLDGANPRSFFGGSLVYMSPEQMEAYNPAHERSAADLDARCDLYSLGITLWELLTGRRPFVDEPRHDGPWSASLLHLTNRRKAGIAPEALATIPADCPEALVRTLKRCLEAEPAKRFPDAQALARALELALYPRTQMLLDPPAGDWRRVARRFPFTAMLIAGLLPNGLAGWFNFSYNFSEVITRPGATDGLREAFMRVQFIINAISFPLGVGLFYLLARPVLRALTEQECRGRAPADGELHYLRRRTLMLGHYGVYVGVGLWILASLLDPLFLRFAVPNLPWHEFRVILVHFVASLTICGLIAAAYPFFLGSALGTGAFYPAFVKPGTTTAGDAADLAAIERALWPHLALAAAVPLTGVAALVLVGTDLAWPMLTLCGAGLLGLGIAVYLMKRIQRDIADLGPAILLDDSHVSAPSGFVSRG